ncbi:MAG: diguanylate cyclase [Blastocatellia bacterium]|nr:diguanylate cyclase [Blastocatellia bacterium]
MNKLGVFQKYNWKYILILIMALAIVGVNLVGSYNYSSHVKLGYKVSQEKDSVIVVSLDNNSSTEKAELKLGDRVVAINDVTIKSLSDHENATRELTSSSVIKLTIKRDIESDSKTLNIFLSAERVINLSKLILGVFLVFIYFIVGIFCYWVNPSDNRTKLSLVFLLLTAGYNSELVDYTNGSTFSDQSISILNILLKSLAFGLLGLLPLYIPEKKQILGKYGWLGLLIFSPALVLAVISLAIYKNRVITGSISQIGLLDGIDINLIHGLFIYEPLVLLHTYKNAKNATVRRQAKTMLYGVTLWAVANTISIFASHNIPNSPLSDPFCLRVADVLLPVTILFTVYKHRLFDIDVLIRKSLIYTFVSTALILLYFIVTIVTTQILVTLFSYQDNVLTVAFSTMMVGVGFNSIRHYSQRLVDRLFFRDKYNYIELLNQLLVELVGVLDLDRVTERLGKKLFYGMKLKRLAILIPDEPQVRYAIRTVQGSLSPDILDSSLVLPSDGTIIPWINTNRAILRSKAFSSMDLSPEETRIIKSFGAELLVPVVMRRLVAVIVLGQKQSEAAYDEDDLNFLSTVSNQVAIIMENARLFELATYDGLTELMRRTAFEGVFEDELRRCRRYNHPLSILMIDIDHFKRVNDKYGHQIGDLVLKKVAKCLKEQLRSTDTPSRYGGEEFCVLLAETNLEAALKVAENLRKKISSMVALFVEGEEIKVTVSIGIYSGNGENLPEMGDIYSLADKALYEAKTSGRNCIRTATALQKAS